MKCRSVATSFPFCLISVSSHHSHSHPPEEDFPRCGGLVALPFAHGWNSPWHFAVCPVAYTPTNHLVSLRGLPPGSLGNCLTDTLKNFSSLSQSPCTGRLTSLSNNFYSSSDPQQPTDVPTFTSSTRRRCGDTELWVMWSACWKLQSSLLFSYMFYRRD